MKKNHYACTVCKKEFSHGQVVSAHLVREPINELIRQDYPGWTEDGFICMEDLSAYRSKYVQSIMVSEKGEISDLDKEVLERMQKQELITSHPDQEFDSGRTFGERLADHIATFGGSWRFLIIFAIFLFAWIAMNSLVMLWRPADPYPFILLNLLLSCLAAIQAPVIMMSQNRQESKDRLRAQNDYQVNLKAELEIRQIHEKLDHLLSKQWERLVEIQEIQIEQLSELDALKKRPNHREE